MHAEIEPSTKVIVAHGIASLIGGTANAIRCHPKSFIGFISNMFVASFSGLIFALMAIHFFGQEQIYLTTAISGTGGYMGVEGMGYITKFIMRAIKANIDNCSK